MSSQAAPVAPPPRRLRRPRSLAGPIILIIIGLVFLLGNFGYVTWPTLGLVFARYWPLLIILWGVIKLVEHYRARREGYAPSGIGIGGVFLLAFLVVFGLAATKAARVDWKQVGNEFEIDDNSFHVFGPFGHPYDFSDELTQDFPARATLRVVSDRGDITVLPWDEKRIKVEVHKRVRAESQSNADKVNSTTKPTITVSGQTVTLNANASAAGDRRVDTDMEIYIPREAAVQVSNARGNVIVRDRTGDVQVNTAHGDVEVSGITGEVKVNLRRGELRADNVSGNVDFSGSGNGVNISNVAGAANITGEIYGSIVLSHIKSGVRFRSARSDMELARLDGDMTLDSGDLRVNSVGGPTRISTRAKDIQLTGVSGDVQIQNNNGDVELRAADALGNISVDNRKGEIRVVLPANAGFRVDGRTYGGDVTTDFPDLKVNSAGSQSSVSGTVGKGGPEVRLNTEHGDIEVRKS